MYLDELRRAQIVPEDSPWRRRRRFGADESIARSRGGARNASRGLLMEPKEVASMAID